MKKVILWIIGSVVALLLCLLILVVLTGFWVVKEVKDYSGYSNDDLIEYVEKKHHIPIEVLSNKGRIPSSFGGLQLSDAYVRTLDGDNIDFVIHINMFGHISSDNYKKQKQRFDLNHTRDNSAALRKLITHGFQDPSFGDSEEDPAFYMSLPENLTFQDQNSFHLIYQALPMLEELRDEVIQVKYDMQNISIGGVLLDLNQSYLNAEDLRNKLASNNIEIFADYLFEEDFVLIEPILSFIEEQGFNKDRDMKNILQCYEMTIYNRCEAYSFILYTTGPSESMFENKFRYDQLEDKERLLKAIQEIQKVPIPIQKVFIEKLYVPMSSEDQHLTEEELRKRESGSHFATMKVEIPTVVKIQTLDDLNFVY